jgi:uncharacterized membrane protein YedE/YeeE
MLVLDRLDIIKRPVRANSPLGSTSPYGGNLLGGALVGLGMSVSGACPGTVLVQLAQGIPSARAAGIGAILGGIAYGSSIRSSPSPPSSPLLKNGRGSSPKSKSKSKSKRNSRHITSPPTLSSPLQTATAPRRTTITEALNVPELAIYSILAAGIIGIVSFTRSSYANSPPITPVQGGLAIGVAQALSLLLTATPLGVSTAYTQIGQYALRALGLEDGEGKAEKSLPKSIIFAAGVIAGSIALTGLVPLGSSPTVQIPFWQALVGGFMMVYGARLGSGCTSGHGLSGLGALSFSSLISVAGMFGTGIASRLIFQALA